MKKLLAIGLLALVFAACGGDDSTSTASGDAPTTTTTLEANPSYDVGSSTTAAAAPASTDATLAVADGHLVGPDGHTVYLFEKDTGTTSACTGGCAGAWPGVTATGTPT